VRRVDSSYFIGNSSRTIRLKVNIQLLEYLEYYKVLICNRIYNYNEGITKK
jgi:hypothetical protein